MPPISLPPPHRRAAQAEGGCEPGTHGPHGCLDGGGQIPKRSVSNHRVLPHPFSFSFSFSSSSSSGSTSRPLSVRQAAGRGGRAAPAPQPPPAVVGARRQRPPLGRPRRGLAAPPPPSPPPSPPPRAEEGGQADPAAAWPPWAVPEPTPCTSPPPGAPREGSDPVPQLEGQELVNYLHRFWFASRSCMSWWWWWWWFRFGGTARALGIVIPRLTPPQKVSLSASAHQPWCTAHPASP